MSLQGKIANDINFYQTQTVLPVDDNGDHPISEFGSVREEQKTHISTIMEEDGQDDDDFSITTGN